MRDRFGREITYLRISVTDFCNLRCLYCTGEVGLAHFRHEEVLSLEEIALAAEVAVSLGVRHIRLTGGEPLLRRNVVALVRMLAEIQGPLDLAMTTNATRLAPVASQLAGAGMKRVNISLDSLQEARYREITRGGELSAVLAGIEAALAAGLEVKLNVVLLPGVNEDEIEAFGRMTVTRPVEVRFIERMATALEGFRPEGLAEALQVDYFPAERVLERLGKLGELRPLPPGPGPARRGQLSGAAGKLGVIASRSEPACPLCNRLRLNSIGSLRACLFEEQGVSLREILRSGASKEAVRDSLKQAFLRAVALKPRAGRYSHVAMQKIGG